LSNWDKFTDSFFNARVAMEYAPKILDGFWLTILLAGCIIVAGSWRG
jgi:polar amino acid transport system permease protein